MSNSYPEFFGAIDDIPRFVLACISGSQNEVKSRIIMSPERTNLKLLELSRVVLNDTVGQRALFNCQECRAKLFNVSFLKI